MGSKWMYVVIFSILAVSCGTVDNDTEETPEMVNPANADALAEVLIMPQGTETKDGNPPPPSNDSEAPEVDNSVSQINSSNGSTAPLNFRYENVNGNLSGCYVQVQGADSYFDISYSGNSVSAGSLQLPIGIPSNIDEGRFCVDFCVYDRSNRVSNIVTTCVDVLRLGTGALQISLSWDNDSDQDLHVTDPTGTTISWQNLSSSSGGQLDRDDTDGFGPENIFWTEDAPDGDYKVEVNDFSGVPQTNFIVTVTAPNTTRTFTGSTRNGSTETVVIFTKNGSSLSF